MFRKIIANYFRKTKINHTIEPATKEKKILKTDIEDNIGFEKDILIINEVEKTILNIYDYLNSYKEYWQNRSMNNELIQEIKKYLLHNTKDYKKVIGEEINEKTLNNYYIRQNLLEEYDEKLGLLKPKYFDLLFEFEEKTKLLYRSPNKIHNEDPVALIRGMVNCVASAYDLGLKTDLLSIIIYKLLEKKKFERDSLRKFISNANESLVILDDIFILESSKFYPTPEEWKEKANGVLVLWHNYFVFKKINEKYVLEGTILDEDENCYEFSTSYNGYEYDFGNKKRSRGIFLKIANSEKHINNKHRAIILSEKNVDVLDRSVTNYLQDISKITNDKFEKNDVLLAMLKKYIEKYNNKSLCDIPIQIKVMDYFCSKNLYTYVVYGKAKNNINDLQMSTKQKEQYNNSDYNKEKQMIKEFNILVEVISDQVKLDRSYVRDYVGLNYLDVLIEQMSNKFISQYSKCIKDFENLSHEKIIYEVCRLIGDDTNHEDYTLLMYYLMYNDFFDKSISKYLLRCRVALDNKLELANREIKKQRLLYLMKDEEKTYEHITIEDIDVMTGIEFELFLEKLFVQFGYYVQVTNVTADQGLDLILKKMDVTIGVQAKRYSNNVGNSAIQEVTAALSYYNCQKGMVVTNSNFTLAAEKLAKSNNIELWDRDILKQKIIERPIAKDVEFIN